MASVRFLIIAVGLVVQGISAAASQGLEAGYGTEALELRHPFFGCGAPGPACVKGIYVSCKVGGAHRGCICSLIKRCQPKVSGCYLHVDDGSKHYCGF